MQDPGFLIQRLLPSPPSLVGFLLRHWAHSEGAEEGSRSTQAHKATTQATVARTAPCGSPVGSTQVGSVHMPCLWRPGLWEHLSQEAEPT